MRAFAAGLFAAWLAAPAFADTTPPSAPKGAGDVPPPSIWQATPDGGYEHRLTGLRCPARVGAYHLRRVELFDKFGLDVGCDYGGPYAGLTYYLTRPGTGGLQDAMDEAKRELEGANAALHPKLANEAQSSDGGLEWAVATYTRDGAMREAIWLADLSGWRMEFRATYGAADELRVSGDIAALAADIRGTVGARLQTCAAAKPATRDGHAVSDPKDVQSASVRTSFLGGLLQSIASDGKVMKTPAPTPCLEHAAVYRGYPMVFSRTIGADGSDALADVVTVVTSGPPITVRFESGGLTGLVDDKPGEPQQWTAAVQRENQTLLYGYFRGRPTIDQMGELVARMLSGDAKPVGGYSVKAKTISVMAPP